MLAQICPYCGKKFYHPGCRSFAYHSTLCSPACHKAFEANGGRKKQKGCFSSIIGIIIIFIVVIIVFSFFRN